MKISIVSFSVFMAGLVCVFFSLLSLSQGENSPLNRLGNKTIEAQNAGIEFYRGLSDIYLSLALLEEGKVTKANNMLARTSEVYFSRALKTYVQITKAASTKPIVLKNVKFEQIGRIAVDLQDFKGHFPNTLSEVAEITVKEFADFVKFIETTRFEKNANVNRQRVRELYERIFRLTTLGLSSSGIISYVSESR